MNVPTNFCAAKLIADRLWSEANEAAAAMRVFPAGPMGLTPDDVKATREWRAAKAHCDNSLAMLRAYNAVYVKRFKRELAAERAKRRA